jgi:foldase protein PrsA
MKKTILRTTAILGAIGMCISFSGCEVKTDTPIIGKVAGLSKDEAFRVGDNTCTVSELKVVLMDIQNDYKNDFGGNSDWNQKMGDTTVGDFIINKAEKEMSVIYAMAALAQKNGVTLSQTEKDKISKAAAEYVGGLSQSELAYTETSTDVVEKIYTNYLLADKLYEKNTSALDDTVSDEDARVISVIRIFIDTTKTDSKKAIEELNHVKKQVENGYQDFLVQANKYSDKKEVEINLKKNEAKQPYEVAAFDLNEGEIGSVIEQKDGAYLVKCISAYVEGATQKNKEQIIISNKVKNFSVMYDKFIKDNGNDINKDAISEIKLSTDKNVVNTELFKKYQTIKAE